MQELNRNVSLFSFTPEAVMKFFPCAVRRALLASTVAMLLSSSPLFAAAPVQAEQSAPINIEANRMVSQENSNSVVFIGKVVAKQGAMTIRTDKMTVYYSPETNDGDRSAGQLEKLVCNDNVQIVQGDWLGTGDQMEYFAKQRKAVLRGNAKASKRTNMITEKTITYYLSEKRSEVEQDAAKGGRVRAVLRPGSAN